jgi:putative spermidine/putrescine transport system permease protein
MQRSSAIRSFQETFGYSTIMALFTIVVRRAAGGADRLLGAAEAAGLRPYIEFITLLPLVIPAIVIVFGYIRLYNTSSWLPLTGLDQRAPNMLLMFGYATLALPYMYRAVDTGLRTIDVADADRGGAVAGRGLDHHPGRVILPNVLVAVLSGAFLTFAIVIGEFTMAALLNRPAFGPYMQLLGANRAYEPAALAVIAFAITWACMG